MEPKGISPERFIALCSQAVEAGARPDGYALTWLAAGNCSAPVQVDFVSTFHENFRWKKPCTIQNIVEHGDYFTVRSEVVSELMRDVRERNVIPFQRSLFLHVLNPCRKCEACLLARSLKWASRAFHETNAASRTWMLTMTVNPHHRMRAAITAREKTGVEDFSSISAVVGRWFTLYMKRLRKHARVPLRYLLAVEEHKDGFPHLHALIHERGGEVGKRLMQMQWPYGFTHCKLADARAARYVTKYVSKQLACRVRASQRYGRPDDIAPEIQSETSKSQGVYIDPTTLKLVESED